MPVDHQRSDRTNKETAMATATLEPRVLSDDVLDDELLIGSFDFEEFDTLDVQARRPATCNFGLTWYCDSDGDGGTCTYGWTYKCDR
jgi:hypothetical protein